MARRTSLAVVVFSAAAAAALVAPAQGHQDTTPISPSATVVFLTTASQDARTELALASLAQQKKIDERVKSFAKTIAADYQNAASQVAQLAEMKNVKLPLDATPAQLATIGRLSKLDGGAFDRAFAEFVASSHKNAVRYFGEAMKSSDAEVRTFASGRLPTLQKHLSAAQALMKEIR